MPVVSPQPKAWQRCCGCLPKYHQRPRRERPRRLTGPEEPPGLRVCRPGVRIRHTPSGHWRRRSMGFRLGNGLLVVDPCPPDHLAHRGRVWPQEPGHAQWHCLFCPSTRGAISIQFAGIMRDLTGTYTVPFGIPDDLDGRIEESCQRRLGPQHHRQSGAVQLIASRLAAGKVARCMNRPFMILWRRGVWRAPRFLRKRMSPRWTATRPSRSESHSLTRSTA
ncbi:hypothetical protein NKDENANG_03066 [Candidatus Entotheonellaceae bacterium PAL068K]